MYLLYILQQMLSGWEKCQIQRCQMWCRVLDLVACSVTAEQMFTNFWVEQQRTDEIEGFLLLLFFVFLVEQVFKEVSWLFEMVQFQAS